MAEISGIQLLGVVLMIVLFYLVFHIIAINWSYKMREHSFAFDEENNVEEIEEETAFSSVQLNAKEVKLIPLETRIKEPAAISASETLPAREVVFMPEAEEEVIELSKAL